MAVPWAPGHLAALFHLENPGLSAPIKTDHNWLGAESKGEFSSKLKVEGLPQAVLWETEGLPAF